MSKEVAQSNTPPPTWSELSWLKRGKDVGLSSGWTIWSHSALCVNNLAGAVQRKPYTRSIYKMQ